MFFLVRASALLRVGQLASSRADILPREVVEELSLLQDRVPGFGYPAAARIIEEELGAPVAELFAWFDTVPLAAASLSQVHRARLWGGEEVVVKVQRPRLAALFELDLQALRGVAQYLQRSKKYGGSTRDWIGKLRVEGRGWMSKLSWVWRGGIVPEQSPSTGLCSAD